MKVNDKKFEELVASVDDVAEILLEHKECITMLGEAMKEITKFIKSSTEAITELQKDRK